MLMGHLLLLLLYLTPERLLLLHQQIVLCGLRLLLLRLVRVWV